MTSEKLNPKRQTKTIPWIPSNVYMAKFDEMLITTLALNTVYLNLGQKEITDGTEIYAEFLHSYIHPLMNILASDSQIKHIEIVTAALSTKKVNHEIFNMLPFINVSSFKDWGFLENY